MRWRRRPRARRPICPPDNPLRYAPPEPPRNPDPPRYPGHPPRDPALPGPPAARSPVLPTGGSRLADFRRRSLLNSDFSCQFLVIIADLYDAKTLD